MMLAARVLGMAYLAVGCFWTWKFTHAWCAARWRMTLRGLRESGVAGGIVYPVCFVFWLYEGFAEIIFWPLGVRHELRFRKWLRQNAALRDLAHLASHRR